MEKNNKTALDDFYEKIISQLRLSPTGRSIINGFYIASKVLEETMVQASSPDNKFKKILDEIDTDLSYLEDQYHDEIGDSITKLRHKINNYLKKDDEEN